MKRLSQIRRLILLILREILDESAYSRFLARHQLQPSRHTYRDFLREQENLKARRPRCC